MPEDFRVLIVDDDFHVAKLHAAYVDSVAGFLALAPVGSASLALQAIHSLRPDLVLLDVYLPDASGLDLLQQLDVDTMILRAASDTGSLRKAFRHGATVPVLAGRRRAVDIQLRYGTTGRPEHRYSLPGQ
ncbi:response regulator of citrate/malate metabolism [Arthrobacter sp. UYEF6]